MKISARHFEDMRTFSGLIVSSQDGHNAVFQSTDFGKLEGRPATFDAELVKKLRDYLTELLDENGTASV